MFACLYISFLQKKIKVIEVRPEGGRGVRPEGGGAGLEGDGGAESDF